MFKINKNLEIYFNYTFLFFFLVVSLKKKSGKKFFLNIKKLLQRKSEFQGKN